MDSKRTFDIAECHSRRSQRSWEIELAIRPAPMALIRALVAERNGDTLSPCSGQRFTGRSARKK